MTDTHSQKALAELLRSARKQIHEAEILSAKVADQQKKSQALLAARAMEPEIWRKRMEALPKSTTTWLTWIVEGYMHMIRLRLQQEWKQWQRQHHKKSHGGKRHPHHVVRL